MFKFLAWVHGLLFRLVLWALRLPFTALWGTVVAVVALLGEEVRRYLGLAVSGLLILGAGRATMAFAPDQLKLPLVLTVLALVCIWTLAVLRAIRFTAHNNLVRVRQRLMFRRLFGEVGEVRQRVTDGLARATRGTPVGGAFKGNREERAKAEAAQAAAERQAAREAREAADHEQHLDDLADLEPDPYETQPR